MLFESDACCASSETGAKKRSTWLSVAGRAVNMQWRKRRGRRVESLLAAPSTAEAKMSLEALAALIRI